MSEGWQDISSAPKDGTVVLVLGYDEDAWDERGEYDFDIPAYPYPAFFSEQRIWWIAGGMMKRLMGATRWMPLPLSGEARG